MKRIIFLFLLLAIFFTTPIQHAQSKTRFYYYPTYGMINWRIPSFWYWNRTHPAFWPPKYPPVASYDQRLIDYATSVGETQRLAWLASQKEKEKSALKTALPSFQIETQKKPKQ